MNKQALSDETKNRLKSTAAVIGLGGALGLAGASIGNRLGGTRLGERFAASRPGKVITRVGLGKALTPGAALGGLIGSHLLGPVGDYAGIKLTERNQEKKAQMNNIYLEKLAVFNFAKIKTMVGGLAGKASGAAKSMGMAAPAVKDKAMNAIRTPLGRAVTSGVAGGITAGLIAKRSPEGSPPLTR